MVFIINQLNSLAYETVHDVTRVPVFPLVIETHETTNQSAGAMSHVAS